jgi:hypothetical protein
MYFAIIVTLIVLIIFLFLTIVFIDRKRCKQFSNGTWIDRDGNLLILKIDKGKMLLSFGINEGEEYELSEKEYSYGLNRIPLSSTYKIKVNNGLLIDINYVTGIATVYDKKKKIGKFAKNNLIAIN